MVEVTPINKSRGSFSASFFERFAVINLELRRKASGFLLYEAMVDFSQQHDFVSLLRYTFIIIIYSEANARDFLKGP